MMNNRSKLAWEFVENENAQWPPDAPTVPNQSNQFAHRLVWGTVVFIATVVALSTAGIGTLQARNEAKIRFAETEQTAQSAVGAAAQASGSALSADMLADDETSAYVKWMLDSERQLLAAATELEAPATELAVGDTRFEGRYAAADITLTLQDAGDHPSSDVGGPYDGLYREEPIYRQTRFYRETPQGWLRTQPVPALWGQPRTTTTEHLVWNYRQRDEDVVTQIAQRMDALYAQLSADYGPAHDAGTAKLIVDVRVDDLPGKILLQEQPETLVAVPSPAVYLLPQGTSEADVLAQAVGLALLESLWHQTEKTHSMSTTDAVLAGLRLWELQEMDLDLSAATQTILRGQGQVEELQVACATYAISMLNPLVTGLPLHCHDVRAEWSGVSIEYLGHRSLREIGWPQADSYVGYSDTLADPQAASVLMAMVVDYAVTVYGRESLPRLLAAADQYDSWETLIPHVYGVSFEDFEQGWRTHVAQLEGERSR